ncbi:unnamed protein product [Dimorphilus gyrociliatus]|uniref:Uncharacterized protein n=1 Tax=Dimorphilus gyrociliatus TaxID=2664684 RepID=A0A7I8VSY9_9ANNE|nr:unnamed protein product [Dimorphilus gyrociliatus]
MDEEDIPFDQIDWFTRLITERTRLKLCRYSLIVAHLLLQLSILQTMLSSYVLLSSSKFDRLLTPLDYYTPLLVVISGLWSVVVNLMNFSQSLACTNPESRPKLVRIMKHHNVVSLLACSFHGLLFALVTSQIGINVRVDNFGRKLDDALQSYKSDRRTKEQFDELQQLYKCCGSRTYKDWFIKQWINPKYYNRDKGDNREFIKGGQYLPPYVPFSCCDPKVMRPCIRENVESNHTNYKHTTHLTIYDAGCSQIFKNSYLAQLSIVGILLFFNLVGEFILAIASRYLSLSIVQKSDASDTSSVVCNFFFVIESTSAMRRRQINAKEMYKKKLHLESSQVKKAQGQLFTQIFTDLKKSNKDTPKRNKRNISKRKKLLKGDFPLRVSSLFKERSRPNIEELYTLLQDK